MELKDFASPLAAKNHFIKASFGGFAGSGKTRTATEFIIGCYKKMKLKKPVLFMDNEKGSRFIVPIFKTAGIETIVKDTTSLADVLTAFEFLQKGEIDFLFIDSLSKVYSQFVNDYMTGNNRKVMQLNDWGKVIPDWQKKFADRFVQVEGNIVFTGRGGHTYDMEKDEETGKKSFVKSGVKMKVAGDTPFEPDLNVWMDIDQKMGADGQIEEVFREAHVLKDRSATIDGMVFKNPKFKDFEPVIDFLFAIPIGEVKGASDTSNLAVKDTFDQRKEEREILFAEIKGCMDSIAPGMSAQEKKFRADLTYVLFGTRSGEAMQKMGLNQLREGLDMMKEFTESTVKLMKENAQEGVPLDYVERIQKAEELAAKKILN